MTDYLPQHPEPGDETAGTPSTSNNEFRFHRQPPACPAPVVTVLDKLRMDLLNRSTATGLTLALKFRLGLGGDFIVAEGPCAAAAEDVVRSRGVDLGSGTVYGRPHCGVFISLRREISFYGFGNHLIDLAQITGLGEELAAHSALALAELKEQSQELLCHDYLNAHRHPVVVLPRNREVLMSNRLFTTVAAQDDAAFRTAGRNELHLADQLLDKRFGKVLDDHFAGSSRRPSFFASGDISIDLYPFQRRGLALAVLRTPRAIVIDELYPTAKALGLTYRETTVLLGILNSEDPAVTAEKLGIKLSTLGWNRKMIRSKLGAASIVDMVAIIHRHMR